MRYTYILLFSLLFFPVDSFSQASLQEQISAVEKAYQQQKAVEKAEAEWKAKKAKEAKEAQSKAAQTTTQQNKASQDKKAQTKKSYYYEDEEENTVKLPRCDSKQAISHLKNMGFEHPFSSRVEIIDEVENPYQAKVNGIDAEGRKRSHNNDNIKWQEVTQRYCAVTAFTNIRKTQVYYQIYWVNKQKGKFFVEAKMLN